MPASPWKSKTAIVCGGTAGLGRELAVQLCQQSVAKLTLVARNEQQLQAVRDQLAEAFPSTTISIYVADMSRSDRVIQLATKLAAANSQIDLLIQAVGMSDRGRLQDLTRERLIELLDANVCTSLNAVKYLSSAMAAPSHLVLIGSLACHFAPRFLGGYALAKHALAALAQQSRLELASRGIHVTLASPGPIRRDDAGRRYQQMEISSDVPPEAMQPGGGARLGRIPRLSRRGGQRRGRVGRLERLADDLDQVVAELLQLYM